MITCHFPKASTSSSVGMAGMAPLREQVQAALTELSPEHRQIIVLRDITGLRYDEIAGVLQLSGGTVKSRLYRAREKLASILRRMGNNSDPAASNGQTAGMQGR